MALTQVKTTGLADDAVTSAKIADDAVVTAAIADDAVTGANIADDTVAEANMANDAISLTELKAGTDGQIITYDASGNPTAVGPGNDGQVLTSTGAGSPPAFEDLPASGVTVSNNSNNRVVTGDGSNLNAEANLTFDGTKLGIGTDTHWLDKVTIKNDVAAGTHNWMLHLLNGTHAGDSRAGIAFQGNNATAANTWDGAGIYGANDGATGACNLHLGKVVNGSFTEELKVGADGQVTITDGDLVIGTSGHGIDFSAGSHATNMSSEILDDYEEGDFTVTLTATGGGTLGLSGNDHMKYTKIGNRVFISGAIDCNAHSSATGFLQVNGFPFTVEHDGQAADCSHIGVVYFRGGDSTPGSTGNYGDFAVRWTMGANETAAYAQAVYGGLTDSGSQNTAQYVGESTYIYFNFSYPAA